MSCDIGGVRPVRVTKAGARRFLLYRSGLARRQGEQQRWTAADTLAAIQALEYVQVDPMRVLECNHHLALGARVAAYEPALLDSLLYDSREAVEVPGMTRIIVPAEDRWMFADELAARERRNLPQLAELQPMMDKVLRRITAEGPLSSLDFSDRETVSGWWDPDGERRTRAVRQAMEWLWQFGVLGVSRRAGLRRYFDLADRLYSAQTPSSDGRSLTPAEALLRKYCRANGLVDTRDWAFGWRKLSAGERRVIASAAVESGELVPVLVEDVPHGYYVPSSEVHDLAAAEAAEPEPAVTVLPPLDNLIWLRQRLGNLFDFDYTWEAYVPQSKRNYGPYTCPILVGDSMAGRIDARMDRKRRVLVVNGIWWERSGRVEAMGPRNWQDALEQWAIRLGATRVEPAV